VVRFVGVTSGGDKVGPVFVDRIDGQRFVGR
jgi:hypothetical protein